MSQQKPPAACTQCEDPSRGQLRETVLMLELAVAQVDAALHESSSSVQVLTDAFSSIAETISRVETSAHKLSPDAHDSFRDEVLASLAAVNNKMCSATVALQFYDKLIQRLDHVCLTLSGLSDLVIEPQRLSSPEEWRALQERIMSKYTMAEEHEMFRAMLGGATVNEAISQFKEARKQNNPDSGDIEFF